MELFTSNQRTVFTNGKYIDGVTFGNNIIIEPNAVIYEDCEIGEGSVIGACAVLRPRSKVGKYSLIGPHSCMQGDCSVGDYTTVHWNCEVTSNLFIGNCCFIGPRFRSSNTKEITKGRHGISNSEKPKLETQVIEDNVRIGADVRMVPGITVGHDSLIDQDGLIAHDIEPYSHMRSGKDKIFRLVKFI
jgi:UDP-3-O-[3-hydroxymyristoyl] glucosamine N-acyltransferase